MKLQQMREQPLEEIDDGDEEMDVVYTPLKLLMSMPMTLEQSRLPTKN